MPRILDILLSVIALFLLTPLFIPIVIILLMTGEHKVFYFQSRVGYRNKHFKIIKFATMLTNSSSMGAGNLTLKNDPRVLPFGSFLRKTKINELPQIFNIIIGDLSIVGPRPQMQVSFDQYTEEIRNTIYNVKPGLTGIGSIIFRDEELLISLAAEKGNPHSFYQNSIAPYKGELEMWYQTRRSFMLDIQLIVLTAWVIVSPKSTIYEKWYPELPKRSF